MDALKDVLDFLNTSFFNAIDNVSSLVGLIVSVWVLIKVKKIENNYNARIRIPALMQKIAERASKLIALMDDYPDAISDIKLELASTGADLESLLKKVDGGIRNQIKDMIRRIYSFEVSQKDSWKLRKGAMLLVRLGICEVTKAEYQEMVSDKKRDEVYQLYTDITTLSVKMDNMQKDKMLE